MAYGRRRGGYGRSKRRGGKGRKRSRSYTMSRGGIRL